MSTTTRQLEDLPAPSALPWLGNLHQIDRKQLHIKLEKWAEALGPTYTFKFGPKRILVTSEIDIAISALRDRPGHFRRLSTIEPVARELGINGLFSVEGRAWRPQRNLVTRALARHQIESFFPILQRITDRLRQRWQNGVDAGADTDVIQDLTRFTVDTMATLVFGKDVNTLECEDDAIQRHIGLILPMVGCRTNALLPYWRYIKLPRDYRLERSLKAVREFVDEMIVHARWSMRRSNGGNHRTLLETMLALLDEPGSGLSKEDVYANLITLLLAGEDTTAYSLAWALHLLASNPDLQVTLHRAALDALGDARLPMTYSDTAKLALFEGVAFEAMRMKPVSPLHFLEANESIQLGGIHVPKGTPVVVLTRPPTLDENNYQDAKEFKPQRWGEQRESGCAVHRARAFMQFGAGPRYCPGRHLALLEMKMVLATLARNFSVEHSEDPGATRELFAFTMKPSRLRLRLRRRALC